MNGVNSYFCDLFCKDKQYYNVNSLYNGSIEEYKVCVNMRVLATQNIKDKKNYNMMEFTIDDISFSKNSKPIFKVDDNKSSLSEFKFFFIPSLCITVFKYQGDSINQNYNIYDIEKIKIVTLFP